MKYIISLFTIILFSSFQTNDDNSNYTSSSDESIVENNSLEYPELKILKATVYPNPASTHINIQVDDNNEENEITYHIISMNGQLIEQGQLENGKILVETNYWQTGMYLIRLHYSNSKNTKNIPIMLE